MGKKLRVLTLCVVVSGLLAGPLAYAKDPTLLGWWKLDDGQGAVARDSSGNGNHGTIVRPNAGLGPGGSVWMNDPERGAVISFDGTASGAYVRAGSIPQMTLTNDFTWVFWAKQDTGNGSNEIIFGNRMNENAADFVPRQFIKFTPTQLEWHQNSVGTDNLNYDDIPNGVWLHHVLVKTGNRMTYYRNGVAAGSRTITQALDFPMPLFFGGDNENNAGENWAGRMSDARVYARALTESEIQDAMAGKGPGAETASEPVPATRATDVPRDATLSWTPGEFAATHDVYFGQVFADVNDATRTDPKGVLAGQDQTEAIYDPPGVFAYDQTYYWRIDEVNAAPSNTVFKGGVWSFTVEPYAYPLPGTTITATASSSDKTTTGPQNAVNGSGLTNDLHSTVGDAMWVSSMMGPTPVWIQCQFDRVYQLQELWVWNHNTEFEPVLGYGFKDVTIEYSTDGATWTLLKEVQFAQAPATAGYAHNTTVDLDGVMARYVRLTAKSNWSTVGLKQCGLSEVRFYYVPLLARAPQPATGTTGVSVDASLSWRPGRAAASHQVFFGTDQVAVAAGTGTAETLTDHAYAPDDLTLGTTYYWRVDEVNTVTHPGDVWSFTTQEYRAVDDFERYTDDEGSRIYETWIDGFDNPKANGAIVGNSQAPFAEKSLFFGGKQSMPLTYDNTAGAPYSETERVFEAPQDWTKGGCKSLVLYFFGDPDNTGQLYLKINGTKVLFSGAAEDLKIRAWLPWAVDLASVSTNLQKVTRLAIGVEGPSAQGKLLIDDVRLYPAPAATVMPVDPGTKGLVAWYKLDGDAKDAVGGHDGTLSGNPQPFVAGKMGQAFRVTDDITYVLVPYSPDLGMNTFTVAAWVNVTDLSAIRGILGTRIKGNYTFDLKAMSTMIHGDIGNGTAWLNTAVDVAASKGGVISTGVWHHIAYVVDDATDTARMYLDGALAATATFTGTPLFMTAGENLGIGSCYDGAVERMRGLIDDVRLYNRALSEAEAAALAGRPGPVFKAP